MKRISRRRFVKIMGAAGAAAIIPWRFDFKHGWQAGAAYAAINSPGVPLWSTPLRGVGGSGIPTVSSTPDPVFANTNFYQVTVGQFQDGGVVPALGPTTLWGYRDSTNNQVSRHLGGIIVTPKGTAARIRFTNTLPPQNIIPVDITILGANQAQNRTAVHLHGGLVPWISDGGPFDWFAPDGSHGSSFLNGPGSVLDNIAGQPMSAGQADYYYPNNQSSRLVWYHDHAWGITRTNAYAGVASAYVIVDDFETPVGTTAFNSLGVPVVGGARYLPIVIQDKIFIGPNFNAAGVAGAQIDPTWPAGLPKTPGSLWYAHTYDPKLYKLNLKGRNKALLPDPSVVPEFFGDTMLANGTVYPSVSVDPGRYRIQFLNGCNARFLNLQLYVADASPDGITLNKKTLAPLNAAGPKFTILGTEGGLLPYAVDKAPNVPFNPVTLTGSLILGNAERLDCMVDFSAFAGKTLILYSDAPAPFPVGAPIFDYLPNGTGKGPNTREIMRFVVSNAAVSDPPLNLTSIPVGGLGPVTGTTDLQSWNDPLLVPPGFTVQGPNINLPTGTNVNPVPRRLTLNEAFDANGRLLQLIGTNIPLVAGAGFGRAYLDPATEVVAAGTTEVWKIVNLTADTHPIHFHLVNVQILARQPVKVAQYNGVPTYLGPPVPPPPEEWGWKETVRMNPGEEITVAMTFNLPSVPFTVPSSPRVGLYAPNTPGKDPQDTGLGAITLIAGQVAHEYVWHCHILEHEEHDMMRPLVVIG